MSRTPRLRPERLAEFERMRWRLALALVALVVLVVVGTVGFHVLGGTDKSWVDAVYMTVITLTTVGFAEVIPLDANPAGRVFTILLLLGGMGIVAYAVPLLAAFLIEGHFLHVFARRRMLKAIDSLSGHYLVCGGSTGARHVAEELARTARDVVLVAPSSEEVAGAAAALPEVLCLVGDPTEDEVLQGAGIARAAGVVACMDGDKDNVIVTLTARRLAPRARIVASTELPQNEAKMRAAGADAVVSPRRIGGLRMASELVRPTVVSFLDTMLRDRQTSLRVEEVRIPDGSPVVGRAVGDLAIAEKTGALLVSIRPPTGGGFEFNPPRDRRLDAGLVLVVMTTAEGRRRLEALVGA